MSVEFSFGKGILIWAPVDVLIELADGSFIGVEVEASRTTAPQTVQAGMVLKLALKVPVGMGQPAKIHLKSGTVPMLIEL